MIKYILMITLLVSSVFASRIKDISYVKGVRSNSLIGYGIVVGLNGTGDDDKAKFTIKSLVNMLEKMGVKFDSKSLKVKNIAAVMVTAKLPPFSRIGNKIDVEVSSIGNAKSLKGGVLIMTPLKAGNGKVYAVAQGNLSVNGYSVKSGKTKSKAVKNHVTVGRVPNGATIERELKNSVLTKKYLDLILKNPDFTTAYRLRKTINDQFGESLAKAIDSNTIRVDIPTSLEDKVIKFIAIIENLDVKVDTPAKIVINERTGTIIIGKNVTISSVAISHGNLNIIVEENETMTQPSAFSFGTTAKTKSTKIKVKEDNADFSLLQDKVTLEDLVKALNSLGVSTRDMISIIQAIKESGALQAELEII